MNFKKINHIIHLWLGLSSGLIVTIISITGCIYVFEDELKLFFFKDKIYVDVPFGGHKKPISELYKIAQATVGKEHPIQNIEIPIEANRSVTFRPTIKRNSKAYTYFGELEYFKMVYMNPYTGKVIANEDVKFEFFRIVLALHRNLLLRKEIGSLITGIAVLIFVIILISGIVLWLPQNVAALKRRLSFQWKYTTKWKRKNYDLHNILGFYSSFFLLVIALTGLTWSFDWVENSVAWVTNAGAKTKKLKPVLSDTLQPTRKVLPLDRMYSQVVKQNQNAEMFSINIPKEKKGVVNFWVYENEQLNYNRTQYQFDQYSAKLLMTNTFGDKNNGDKLKAMNYDIHTGRILSLSGKIIAFLASLISATLPITGFLIWLGKRNKSKKIIKIQSMQSSQMNYLNSSDKYKIIVENNHD
ncbi:MAG: PepSY-associated TM helix domain-containing protein [Bacteroidota bacterium]